MTKFCLFLALLRLSIIAYIIVVKVFSKECPNTNSWLNNLFLVIHVLIVLVTAFLAAFVSTYIVISSSCYAYVCVEPENSFQLVRRYISIYVITCKHSSHLHYLLTPVRKPSSFDYLLGI